MPFSILGKGNHDYSQSCQHEVEDGLNQRIIVQG